MASRLARRSGGVLPTNGRSGGCVQGGYTEREERFSICMNPVSVPLPLPADCGQAGCVVVREWDPRTAPSAEIDTMVSALNAMLAVDLPDDPPWRTDAFREYLSVTMPGEERIFWIAEASPGSAGEDKPGGESVLGQASVLLFDKMAVLEVFVHPAARGTGVGRELLTAAVNRANDEGFAT